MAIQINGKKVVHLGSVTIPIVKGDKGEQGEQGIQGVAGKTPINGVDYNTPAEAQMMKDEILQQLGIEGKIDDINNAGQTALDNIDTAKTNATQELETKQDELLEELGQQSAELRIQALEKENTEQQEELEALWNDFKPNTVSGETAIVNDGVKGSKVEVIGDGNSYQETTEGYNYYGAKDQTKTINGITVDVKKGVYKITGTSTTYATVMLDRLGETDLTGKYCFQYEFVSGTISGYGTLILKDVTTGNELGSLELRNYDRYITVELANANIRPMLYFDKNVPVNMVVKPMLYEGSYDENKPFEPYTNGASPNTEYEQPIEVIEAYNKLNPANLLLFNANKYIQTKTRIDVMPNTEYSIVSNKAFTDMSINGYSDDTNYEKLTTTLIIKGNKRYYTFTTKANTKTLHFYVGQDTEYTTIEEYLKSLEMMLIKGTEDKPYLPYGHIGLKQRGKNYLNFDYESQSVTTNGVTVDFDKSTGKFKITGKATTDTWVNIYPTFKAGTATTDAGKPINTLNKYTVTNSNKWGSTNGVHLTCGKTFSDGTSNYKELTAETMNRAYLYFPKKDIEIDAEFWVMICDDYNQDEYEPYIEPIVHSIDLAGNSLAKVGDIKDLLNIGINGRVSITKGIKEKIYDGTEKWSKSSYSNDEYLCAFNNVNGIKQNSKITMCNYLPQGIYTNTSTKECIGNNELSLNIKILVSALSENSVEGLQAFLKELYDNGVPMKVLYQKAETEVIDLPSIEPVTLFEGTNIFELVTNLGTTLSVTYKVSNNSRLEALEKALLI